MLWASPDRASSLAQTRPSARTRTDETLVLVILSSFTASARTYGARRVWRDVLETGLSCGLQKIERLMRANALRARPRARGLPKDDARQHHDRCQRCADHDRRHHRP